MQHNKRHAAALLAGVLLLTGCGAGNSVPDQNSGGDLHDMIEVQEARETDLSKRYPDYFKYCFGDDAQFKYLKSENNSDFYQLTYHDHTGTERTGEVEVELYDFVLDHDDYASKTEYYNQRMIECVTDQMRKIVRRELAAEVLEPILGGHWNEEKGWVSDTESVLLMSDFQHTAAGMRIADHRIKSGSGWRVCTADWKSIVSDELWYLNVSVTIPADTDASEYTKKFEQIEERYLNCTDQPKSVSFLLLQKEPEGSEHSLRPITNKNVILGEEVTQEQYGKDSTPLLYMVSRLKEKYGA